MAFQNNNSTEPRKYEELWNRIKRELTVVVQLDMSIGYTEQQALRTLRTIRKAVSKEKYYDLQHRTYFPNSEVTSELSGKLGRITFVLTKDVTDVTGLF